MNKKTLQNDVKKRRCLLRSGAVITARFAFNQAENSSLRFLLAIVNAAQQECQRAFLSRRHSIRGPCENATVVLCRTLDRASSPVTVCSYRRTVSGQRLLFACRETLKVSLPHLHPNDKRSSGDFLCRHARSYRALCAQSRHDFAIMRY